MDRNAIIDAIAVCESVHTFGSGNVSVIDASHTMRTINVRKLMASLKDMLCWTGEANEKASPNLPDPLREECLALSKLAQRFHATAKEKGWHDEPREAGTRLALIHAEVSELLEALRAGTLPSPHIPMISHAEEEAADILIRTLEFCATEGYDIARAVHDKHQYNKTRSHKHGGKSF